MKNRSIDLIDSFQRIHERKELQILAPNNILFREYIDRYKESDEMMKDISTRFTEFQGINSKNEMILPNEILINLMTGKYVLLMSKYKLDAYLRHFQCEKVNVLKKLL